MSWFSLSDLVALLPVLLTALGGCAVLLVDAICKGEDAKLSLSYISFGSIAAAMVAASAAWATPGVAAGGSLVLGPFASLLALVVLASGAVTVLYSSGYAKALGFELGEYYGLILLALSGMVYLAAANDLVTIFIAFELMSLAVYALAAIWRGEKRGYEGALKYFVLGAFSSGFLLFGLALIYGASGTIYLDQMHGLGRTQGMGILLTGFAMTLVGFAFKVGAVPFHSWVPDAYHGAPASVTGFMAVAVKAAAFAILIRVLVGMGLADEAISGSAPAVTSSLWALAFVTMVIGNAIALAQTNLKRLLAYSGIAHSGYVLVGLAAASRGGLVAREALSGSVFYLAGYAAMTLGVFAVLTALRRGGKDIEHVDDLAGLGRERPALAAVMTICLFSLVGMPPTVGFFGKLWIFRAAAENGLIGLVIVACVATMISIYYYLRPVVVMFTQEARGEAALEETTLGNRAALWIAAAATILLGVAPSGVYEMALRGVDALSR